MMQNTEFTMATFFTQFIVAIAFFVKPGTPFNNFFDPLNAFFHHYLYNIFIAQSISGN